MSSVKEVMTTHPCSCEPDTSITEVARMMSQEDVGPIPIVENDRLIGIVTDRDIVLRVVAEGRDPGRTTADEIASKQLVTVEPDDDLDEALGLLARYQVRRLPVVEDERLVGILAQADIARNLTEQTTGHMVEEISR